MSEEMIFDIDTTENDDVEITYLEPEEVAGKSGIGKVVGIGLAVLAAAGGVALVKTKKLRTKRRIKLLEKEGYVVLPSEEVKEVVEVDEFVDDVETEE